MNETSNMKKHGNELLKFAIDLGGNEIKYINIYDDTNPEELAYNFCYVNHLDYHSLIQLREKIKNALINNKRILTTKESTEIRSLLSNDYDDLSKPVDKINKKNEKIQREIFENLNENSYFKNKKPNTNNNKLYKSLKNNKIPKKNNSLDKTNYSYRAPTICSSTRKKLTLSNNLSINDSNDNKTDVFYNDNFKRSHTNFSTRNNNKINSNSNYRIKSTNQIQSLLYDNKEKPNINYGERLYHKCEKINDKINNKIQKIKNEEETKLNNTCTFKPKINKMSYYTLSYRNNNKSNYDNDDSILYYREYIDRKLSYLKERYAQKDENCYFSPKINKTKEKNKNLIPRYEQLYQNSKELKTKREFLTNSIYNNSFKPSINKVYHTEMTNLPFDQRQNAFNSRTNEKKKQMKSQIENNIDSITGQKFFKPKINEKSNILKRNSNDIFNNLYSDHKKQIIKKQQVEKEINEKFCPLETFASEQSNEIFIKQKVNCFEKIFYILDKDQDGIISKFNIYTNGLPKNIQKILSPIIIELKEDNETLNKDEFSAACFKLYDTLEFLQKREIINYGMNKKNNKNNDDYLFTFKPKIQKNYDPNVYYEKLKKEQEEENNIEKKNTNKTNTNSNNQENNEEINLKI